VSRPAAKFRDFIGHKATVDLLRRQLAGAQTRKKSFPHALFLGPSGVGKTRLARALAAEYGTNVIEAMVPPANADGGRETSRGRAGTL
jgi:Holliday junction resolvasome RuvABC ATP-dependent DNA helicase subunit